MRLLIALLLCASLHAQPKQLPSNSGTDGSQKESNANNNQSGPDRAKALASGTAREAKPIPPETNQDADPNRKIAAYTEALAHYTLALVVVGIVQVVALGVQGFFLFRAFRETQTATSLTRQSNAEVLRANAATEALTSESNEITRQALTLTHRPRLIVRSFHGSAIKAGQTADGAFQIVNIGGTAARITRIHATAMVFHQLPMRPPYEDTSGIIVNKKLSPGESLKQAFKKDDGALTQQEVTEIGLPTRAIRQGRCRADSMHWGSSTT